MKSALPELPQLTSERPFLTDGGLETSLIFHQGLELPCFAAFPLLDDDAGRAALRAYFEPFLEIARERGLGFILETATWRANRDWGEALGYSTQALVEVNGQAVAFAQGLREAADGAGPVVIEGAVGPRGDGYRPTSLMSVAEAEAYHADQIGALATAGADMVTGLTLNYMDEAIGIVRAAVAVEMPVVISLTTETDGCLPTGQTLREAIENIDTETGGAPAYYMINCAHPTHFGQALAGDGEWLGRIRGIRANASKQSHAELDEAEQLDDGDPLQMGRDYRALRGRLPNLGVLGGCCGTDQRHVAAVADAWLDCESGSPRQD